MSKKLLNLSYFLGFAAAGTMGMNYLYFNKLSENLLNNENCEEVLDEVRKHKGAVFFLGEPIDAFKANFEGKVVKIFVSGPKSKGIVFANVLKDELENVQTTSIELQIGSDDTKRLLIRKNLS